MAKAAGADFSDDERLVAGAMEGHRECFGALVDRYWATAVALALSRVSDPSQAEDVAQESFVRAYCHLATLRDHSRFAGWLSRIVIQQSINQVRMNKRLLTVANADVDGTGRTTGTSTSDYHGLSSEQHHRIHDAVRQLPEKWRTVVVLRFISGLSTEQIAAQLEQRSGTVRVWLHRAYQKLRADLAPLAEEVKQT